MVKKILCQGYLWLLLLLLYAPIFIIMIYSFTEAKVLGNWTGFSTKLYSSLFVAGTHHSLTNALVNTLSIAFIAATVSTLLGSITAIGIFNLRPRARKAISFVNNIPILNGDIIIGISLFLLFVSLVFKGPKLKPGMVIAIEPMINIGSYQVGWLNDDWTVVTMDGSRSAHYENTVLITEGDPEILSRAEGLEL